LVLAASSLGLLALTARVLGAEGRGLVAGSTAWVTLFASLGSLSLGQVMIGLAAGRAADEWLGEAVGTLAGLFAAASLICGVGAITAYLSTNGAAFGSTPASLLGVAFIALPFAMWLEGSRYLLNASGQLRVFNRIQIFAATSSLAVAMILAAAGRLTVQSAVATAVGGTMLGAMLATRAVSGCARQVRFSGKLAGELLGGSLRLHANAIGTYLFGQASVLVLSYYRPAADVGVYHLAIQMFGFLLLVPNAIGTVAYGLVAQHGPDRAWAMQRELIIKGLCGVAATGAIAYLCAPAMVEIVAGPEFLESSALLRILLPALLGAAMSSVMASQWVGRRLFAQSSLVTLAVGVASLTLDLILVPRFGVRGAAVSTLVTYALSFAGNAAMAAWVGRRVLRSIGSAG
jgi:O-antigen/teichoic acid export membrane protein